MISTVARPVIEQDGLCCKDIDGSGAVSSVNAYRDAAGNHYELKLRPE